MPAPSELRDAIFGAPKCAPRSAKGQPTPDALRRAIMGDPDALGPQDAARLAMIVVGGAALTAVALQNKAHLHYIWMLIEELCT